ncbi:hypothetical protein [Novosphingobium sp. EMRT-2]|uniref:hypothetical protein n=1 Tax=Novosphingobium sp. EMRT-2 TaxID=2571749 RepID=UPI0010BD8F17|nr:hypothetical protein [Novosphingobium sp. EMRT-2]QCI92606.1 hypothetical protein FA702_02900 [Novosphingobium sp. EMRT-2]
MIRYVTYDVNDGVVIAAGFAPDEESAMLQNHGDESVVVDITAPVDVIADGRWQWTGESFEQAELAGPSLELAKEMALGRVSTQFRIELAKGCPTPLGWADCDEQAQQRITTALLLSDCVATTTMAG